MDVTQLHEAINRLDDRIVELISKQSEHNALLRTHEERSLALQRSVDLMDARVKPVESHVKFINLVLKLLGMILVGFTVQALVKYFLNM